MKFRYINGQLREIDRAAQPRSKDVQPDWVEVIMPFARDRTHERIGCAMCVRLFYEYDLSLYVSYANTERALGRGRMGNVIPGLTRYGVGEKRLGRA